MLQELWEFVLDGNTHPDVRTHVIGVRAQMESFKYFFGISIAELVLRHGDNLSATLQSNTISAAEGQHVASLTTSTIAKMRTNESFSHFWEMVQNKAAAIHVNEPRLHCRRVPLCDSKQDMDQRIFLQWWKLTTTRFILRSWTMQSLPS